MRRWRLLAAALALGCLAPGCAMLRDPIQPWQVDIIYADRGTQVVARPPAVTVDGPFGYVVLTNQTQERRGFAIDALAVYEQVGPGATVRIRVEEARNHRTYNFYDHLHSGTIRGRILTRFVTEQQR